MEAAREVEAAYPELKVSAGVAAEGPEMTLCAGDAKSVLTARRLKPEDRSGLAPYEGFDSIVDFAVPEITPESAGLCWDILVAVNAYYPCAVWLSRETYDETAISRSAPVRQVQLQDLVGYLLQPEEFSQFLEES